jgi:hypothetical protein
MNVYRPLVAAYFAVQLSAKLLTQELPKVQPAAL